MRATICLKRVRVKGLSASRRMTIHLAIVPGAPRVSLRG